MGMYDYMGGEQIKCFPLVFVNLREDNSFNIGSIGGNFRGYKKGDKVPYQTLYYNYGKNFAILDYFPALCKKSDYKVHLIEKGKYIKTVSYKRIPKNYSVGKVVNYNGKELNIHSADDFKFFINDLSEIIRKDNELTDYYNKVFNVKGYNLDDLKKNRISSEEFIADLNKREKVLNMVCEETTKPFSEKWYIEEEVEENLLVGYLLDSYMKLDKSESDWNNIFDSFIKYMKDNNMVYEDLYEKYMSWVRKNNITIHTDKLEELSEKILSRGV